MTGQTIRIKSADGKSFGGYLAVPEAGKGPGLLLLQEIFGVNETMRKAADLYAATRGSRRGHRPCGGRSGSPSFPSGSPWPRAVLAPMRRR